MIELVISQLVTGQVDSERLKTLNTISVYSSRLSESVDSRLDSEDIDIIQPDTLLETLDRTAGVRAVSTSGIGGGSFVSVRGGEPNFTLVTLNGVRVSNPSNSAGGAFDFSLLDPSSVDEIDIVKNGRSAIYGADALSGIINIRLKSGGLSTQPVTASIAADSDGGVRGTLSGGLNWQDGGFFASIAAADSAEIAGNSFERYQGSLNVDHS
ncbi:MAG: TonB-dependent receptor plug domain-containing protein, partial [Pseudomonadota bacterium]